MRLRAFALNCTLKASPEPSSVERLLDDLFGELRGLGVDCEQVRAADHDIRPGVTSDEGEGDDWPALREKVLAADIFVLATPIWLGHPSSFAQRVLERMDAFLGETDDAGRMVTFGTVGCVAVCGNEDGAHHVTAELYQGLADVGFTIPASGATYWVGEAMQTVDYKDHAEPPEKTAAATAALAVNATHLARVLREHPYPQQPGA
jgi:multimeric flavodoxin WrbA